MTVEVPDYGYQDAAPRHTARYLLPPIKALFPPGKPLRVLDVGCGSGYNASQYAAMGHHVVGVDLSESGIAQARKTYPNVRFELVEAGANFLDALNEAPFDVVTSTEVVEHLYDPRSWARACHAALKPGGRLICTTPYHGYLKNLALAVCNKMDFHLNPLWDGGHIKFWSHNTLSQLLTETNFTNIQFRGAGRAPYLWMSMVMAGDRAAHQNGSPRVKIAHLLSTFRLSSGGPVRAVIDLSAAFAAAGHDITIFTWDDEDIPAAWKADPAGAHPRIHLIPPPALPGQFLSRAQLRAIADPLRAHDVLHLHGVWEPVNMQVARLAQRIGLPYVISSRGMLDEWSFAQKRLKKQIYLTLAGKRMLDNAARIHLTAEGELQQSKRHFDPSRGTVIPNLIDLAAFENLPGPGPARRAFNLDDPTGPPTVLFLGRLHKIKALDVLIRAAGHARAQGTDLRLVLAGPGPDDYIAALRQTAEAAGITDRLTLTGMVKGDLKLSLLQAADLFVLPSHHENFGFVLVEAMACGTPVLASRGVLIWPDIEQSGAGFVADVSEKDFTRALIDALAAPALLNQMRGAAREWVAREFAVAGVVERFSSMYAEAGGGIHANSP